MSKLITAFLALLLALPAAAQPAPASSTRPAATATSTAGFSANRRVLQRQLMAERAKVDDLKLKLRIKASMNPFSSPLQNFFDSPEFWENPLDTGERECASRCIASATATRRVCAAKTDAAERLKCYQDASDSAANCQRGCIR